MGPSAIRRHRNGEDFDLRQANQTMYPVAQRSDGSTIAALRRALAEDEPLLVPGVFNGMSARVATEAGFRALYVSGLGVAGADYGLPDRAMLGLSEMVESCRRITSVTPIPVIADGDTGHGNELMIAKTVREFAAAGAAGITLEDQSVDKRCGYTGGLTVVSVSEMEQRIAAARAAAGNDGPVIIARTDVWSLEGFEAGLERANRMAQAGADVVWVLGLQNLDAAAMKAARARVDAPMMVDHSEIRSTPVHDFDTFARAGFDIVLTPLSGVLAALKTMQAIYAQLFTERTWRGYEKELFDLGGYHAWAGRIIE